MKKMSIAKVIKNAFTMSLMLSMLIGAVGIYSWYQQNKQVNYILDDYFPKNHLALQLEEQVAAFLNELDRFASLKSNVSRQSMFKQLNLQLEKIEHEVFSLSDDLNDNDLLLKNMKDLKELILKIHHHLGKGVWIEQKKQELVTKLQWLHDDFNNELVALGQELNWQQMNLSKQPLSVSQQKSEIALLQNELQAIELLKNTEDQIKTEIYQFIYSSDKDDISIKYQTLKELINDLNRYDLAQGKNTSFATLQQIVDMLANMLAAHQDLDIWVENILQFQRSTKEINEQQASILLSTRKITENILAKTNENLTAINMKMKHHTEISGIIIFIALFSSLIFIGVFNYFYLQGNLTVRLEYLIDAVKRLNNGEEELPIQVQGNDEIAEMNYLLKQHTQIIKERKIIAQNLRDAQDELIQTAKLAVVGQTMTSLAHEINQPLNAISIYLFSLKKVLKDEDITQAKTYIDKMSKLTDRISQIVKGLRQFTKKHTQNEPLQSINVKKAIDSAWELLELKHQPVKAKLFIQGESNVNGNDILLEQVFVNLFANALEAAKEQPEINIEIMERDKKIFVYVQDNGEGWQLENADKLLQPFYSNKEVGLGLGLTICQRIMQQFNGNLYIASNQNKGATIILEFPVSR